MVLAVAGTTFGYAALSKSVTLTLDGQDREVTAMGGTVGDVLDAEGIEVGDTTWSPRPRRESATAARSPCSSAARSS